MENLYVSDLMARELKILGFNLRCNQYLDSEGYRHLTNGYFYHNLIKTRTAVPFYDQVIDWFDIMKIFISINYAAPDTNKFNYRIDNCNDVIQVIDPITKDPTCEMVGEYGIFSIVHFSERIEAKKEAIKAAIDTLKRIEKG